MAGEVLRQRGAEAEAVGSTVRMCWRSDLSRCEWIRRAWNRSRRCAGKVSGGPTGTGEKISVGSKVFGEAQERSERRSRCGHGFSDSGSGGRWELRSESVFHRGAKRRRSKSFGRRSVTGSRLRGRRLGPRNAHTEKTLEGNEAQGSNGQQRGGNITQLTTDFLLEQGLEVGWVLEALESSVATRWSIGSRAVVTTRRQGPWRHGTAGREGNASEGMSCATGKAVRTAPGSKGRGERRAAGNVADPMAGCRAQQTYRRSRGVSRRSREERQGRNVSGPWQVPTEGEVSAELGVDARQYAGGGADLWTTP